MLLVLMAALIAAPVMAQGVYRIVGPDGRVSYSDQPPNATARPVAGASTAGSSTPLPFELRQTANRYPVTLYTSAECAPCNSGRNLLNARGIPYSEKTVNTAQDSDALKRLSGDTSLPFLTIGGQQLKGYSDTEWTQFLDAAGYPKQSALPASYRRPAASPLVEVKPAEAAAPQGATSTGQRQSPTQATVPVAPPGENPAGIRF
jgi:glutaredoxin